ncbi:four helix bundle protein [Fibrella sp. HMF5335]|uniref:Four helix bundle protein n=1 Tax=Fibrella rubiginis TaxID=2817060 RepID=A0A939K8A9_9BACT|nr:four helix bundle protein [Fibrella rubiginis]MBO0939535.1 four helix bundle protein [Fibrella rubiginis]
MPTIQRFEDLRVWQNARLLDQKIFRLTQQEVMKRDFRLIGQWLGASGSVMDNIAEGFDREGNKEFIQFLSIAKGSAGEVRSQGYRALDRGYSSEQDFQEVYQDAVQIRNQLTKLMNHLKSSDIKGVKYQKLSNSSGPNKQTDEQTYN